MVFRKIALGLSVVMLLSFGLVGCGQNTSNEASQPESAPVASESGQSDTDSLTRTVTDELGREVEIPVNPQRALALTSAATQALFKIGITPVGAVDEYKIKETDVKLPSIGSGSNVNIESIYSLKPDIIFASSRHHSALVEELEGTGAAVYYFDPLKVGDIPIVDLITYIGNLMEKENEAKQYVDSVLQLAEDLSATIAAETDIKTGIIIQDGDTITAAQSASPDGSILSLLKIENVVPEDLPNAKKAAYVQFDIETILENDPDLIFIRTTSNDEANNKAVIEKFKNDPQWSTLKAVKEGKILIFPYAVNANLSTAEEMLETAAESILKK